MSHQARFRFADFLFDPVTGDLLRGHQRVPLEHQPAILLGRLVATPGELVTRDDLAAALWGTGTHVNVDDGLNYCVRAVRVALGDDAKAPRFVATVPRRGYRFVAPVTVAVPPRVTAGRPGWRAVAIAAVVALIVTVERMPNNHHEIAVAIARTLHDLIF